MHELALRKGMKPATQAAHESRPGAGTRSQSPIQTRSWSARFHRAHLHPGQKDKRTSGGRLGLRQSESFTLLGDGVATKIADSDYLAPHYANSPDGLFGPSPRSLIRTRLAYAARDSRLAPSPQT